MKFKSEIVTQVSGSIGGTTYSHNKGGMYRRARAIPTNPNSSFQQAVRMYLAQAAAAWSGTLTPTQRTTWNNYAAGTPVTDKLGDQILLSGQQMFIRSNVFRMNAGLAMVTTGPSTPGLAAFNGVTIVDGGGQLNVTYDNSDPWAAVTDGAMVIQISHVLPAGISYFKGPYRLASIVLGDTATPPTSPEVDTSNGFGQSIVGQRIAVRVMATESDGRLTPAVSQILDIST